MKLVADKLAVRRAEHEIFADVSFSLETGHSIVVTGPNGAGKSTLLKTIAGFIVPHAGSVALEGGGEGGIEENCHYLGHDNALKPTLTVHENLSFWQHYLGPGASVGDALEKVAMSGMEDIPAGYLSAGQKRRVAIARLLVSRRPVWLVDEPTAALDRKSEARFGEIANAYMADGGMIVAATHSALSLDAAELLDMAAHSRDPAR